MNCRRIRSGPVLAPRREERTSSPGPGTDLRAAIPLLWLIGTTAVMVFGMDGPPNPDSTGGS